LEAELAEWLKAPAARLFNAGYAANVGVMTTLARRGDVVFSDALNHASVIDGCRLSRAEVTVYPHLDVDALERGLAACAARRKLVVTESLFSMDGDTADVVAIAEVCRRHGAALIVDEAHAVGAVGPQGRGLCAEAGVTPDVLIGTCGKALGSFGAFVATTTAIAELLWNRARSFVFSTALPAGVVAATRAAIEIVRGRDGDALRAKLVENARAVRAVVRSCGGAPDGAIAPIVVGDDARVMAMSARLLEQGVFVQGIRPPTVPEGTSRLRVSVSAVHEVGQVRRAAAAIAEVVAR
jgi:8-amino-7-oxononanoate synthase